MRHVVDIIAAAAGTSTTSQILWRKLSVAIVAGFGTSLSWLLAPLIQHASRTSIAAASAVLSAVIALGALTAIAWRDAASRDCATNLLNRRSFELILERAAANALG